MSKNNLIALKTLKLNPILQKTKKKKTNLKEIVNNK